MTTTETSAPITGQAASFADQQTLREVRPAVRDLLVSSEAFAALEPAEQQRLAQEMVKVSAYLANPEGLATEELARADRHEAALDAPAGVADPALATAQAQQDPTTAARRAAVGTKDLVNDEFKASAMQQGTESFGALVQKVDFPMFVSGLIHGVFDAIVDTSIKQMRAYGELVANVAKTVDQFAQDNITSNNARDYLANRFPESLSVGDGQQDGEMADDAPTPPPAPKLQVTAEDPEAALKQISTELNLANPITDLSDENQEAELVRQARLQIARSRQQMLASMVMMGINRIVVTDGSINAKVVFDIRTTDSAKRVAKASMADKSTEAAKVKSSISYSSWMSPVSAESSAEASTEHVATVQSSVDDTSESKATMKAQLSGEVRVNFKSDYFPMDKMASPQMIGAIQGNAVPPDKPTPGA